MASEINFSILAQMAIKQIVSVARLQIPKTGGENHAHLLIPCIKASNFCVSFTLAENNYLSLKIMMFPFYILTVSFQKASLYYEQARSM